jgi:hypothetical protein
MRASALDVELETWLVVKQPPESSTSEMLHEIEFTNYEETRLGLKSPVGPVSPMNVTT